jgi:hypothetical protein
MTTPQNKPAEPQPPPAASGDDRSAGDLDGNKAGAKTANKAEGPDEPEEPTGFDEKVQE